MVFVEMWVSFKSYFTYNNAGSEPRFVYDVNPVINPCHLEGGYIGPEAPKDPIYEPPILVNEPFPLPDILVHKPGSAGVKLPPVTIIHREDIAAEVPVDSDIVEVIEGVKEAAEEAVETAAEVGERVAEVVREVINIVIPILIKWWQWFFPPAARIFREFFHLVVEVISSITTSDRFVFYVHVFNYLWIHFLALLNTIGNSRIFEFFVHLINHIVNYSEHLFIPNNFFTFFTILNLLRSWATTYLLLIIDFIVVDITLRFAESFMDVLGVAVFFLMQLLYFFGTPYYFFQLLAIYHYLHVVAMTALFILINFIISNCVAEILSNALENLYVLFCSSTIFNYWIYVLQTIQLSYITAAVLLVLFVDLSISYLLKFIFILFMISVHLLYYFILLITRNTHKVGHLLVLHISIIYQLVRVIVDELAFNLNKLASILYFFLFLWSSYFLFFLSINLLQYCVFSFLLIYNPNNSLAALIFLKFFFIIIFFFYYNFFRIVFNFCNFFFVCPRFVIRSVVELTIFVCVTTPFTVVTYLFTILLKLLKFALPEYPVLLFEAAVLKLSNFFVFVILDCRDRLLIFLNFVLYFSNFFSINILLLITLFVSATSLIAITNIFSYFLYVGFIFLTILASVAYIFSNIILLFYRLGIFNNTTNLIILRFVNFFFVQFMSTRPFYHIFFLMLFARLYVIRAVFSWLPFIIIVGIFLVFFSKHMLFALKRIARTFLNITTKLKQHLFYGLLCTKKYLNSYKFIFINFLNYIAQIIVIAFKDKSLYLLLRLAKFYYNVKRYFTNHLFTKCAFLKIYIYEWYIINLYYASWTIKNFRKLSVKLIVDNTYNMYGRFIRYLNFRHQYFLENSRRYFLVMHWWRNISLKQAHMYTFFVATIIKSRFTKTIKNIHKSTLAPKTGKSKNSLFYKIFGDDKKKK